MTTDRSSSFGLLRRSILGLSLCLYLIAPYAPYAPDIRGGQVFLMGLFLCWHPYTLFSWWANPAYWIALWYFRRRNWPLAAAWGLLATALGSVWLLVDSKASNAPAFLLWVGSMAVLYLGVKALAIWGGADQTGDPGGLTPTQHDEG